MIDLNQVPTEARNELAFQMVVAMRDTINIAKKKGHKSTYENSIQLFNDFSPELYDAIVTCLPQRNLSDEAKLFKAKAEALSKERGKPVNALELLNEDIELYKQLKEKVNSDSEEHKLFRNKIGSLESLRKSLVPRKLTENRILIRDTSKADRRDFGAKFLTETDFYIDYTLTDEKYLRIRLLHPDEQEHMTGADLVYEQHNLKTGLIRIIMLQYKIWEDGILYFSKAKNLDNQIKKLQNCMCNCDYCTAPKQIDELNWFRFPHCAAFLRPTDKLQEQNEKLVSSGIHIPVCMIDKLKEIENGKISKNKVRYQSLTHELFEILFNKEFIGSRWMKESEVESFYKTNKILQSDESIILYAREVKEDKIDANYTDASL